jgi:large subunit ribosomal protein L1
MAKITKNQKDSLAKIDKSQTYSVADASKLVKEITTTKFDASVDLAIRLNVDPRKANQMVRGVVTLPHGTGKDVKVLALVTPDKEAEALEAGADFVGLDEYLDKIKGGWTDVDVIITMPSVMGRLLWMWQKQFRKLRPVKSILRLIKLESYMRLLERHLLMLRKLQETQEN